MGFCLCERLDQMISSGPFQPYLFCGFEYSVAVLDKNPIKIKCQLKGWQDTQSTLTWDGN